MGQMNPKNENPQRNGQPSEALASPWGYGAAVSPEVTVSVPRELIGRTVRALRALGNLDAALDEGRLPELEARCPELAAELELELERRAVDRQRTALEVCLTTLAVAAERADQLQDLELAAALLEALRCVHAALRLDAEDALVRSAGRLTATANGDIASAGVR